MKFVAFCVAVSCSGLAFTTHAVLAEINRPVAVASGVQEYRAKDLTRFVKALDREWKACTKRPHLCPEYAGSLRRKK
jgi:hypothetical protein